MKKFFVFDGSALIYKAYFAMINNPMKTKKGQQVSAVYGIANQILSVITREAPDYLCVAMDTKEPTFRHEKYPAYKGTRAKMPDELIEQLPLVRKMVDSLSLPVLEMPGWEADDIIGTLSKDCIEKNIHLYIVSSDKDFMQLVGEHCSLYTIKKGQEVNIISYDGVKEKFNCRPDQVIDVLAMMGDSADNIPGIKGIGEKTALKLIETYGSLDGLYQNVDDLKGKQKEKVIESKELAYLSKELVTIQLNCPIERNWGEWQFNRQQLNQKPDAMQTCAEFDFENLSFRIKNIAEGNFKKQEGATPISAEEPAEDAPKKASRAVDAKPKDDITENTSFDENKVKYHLITNKDQWNDCYTKLKNADFILMDTETDGLDCIANQLAGLSFAIEENEAWYLPVNYPKFTANADTRASVMKEVKEILENPSIGKGGQNIKFDYRTLLKENIRISPITFDTMVASNLVHQNERILGIDKMAEVFLNYKKIPTTALIGEGLFETTMLDLPAEKVYIYACEDADIALRLKNLFLPKIKEMGMEDLFNQIEMPLISVLGDMEQNGIFVEKKILAKLEKEFAKEIERLTKEIHELAGRPFNINSPKELGHLFFDVLEIHKAAHYIPKKTKIGWSTGIEVLNALSSQPIAKLVIEYRTLNKLLSSYVKSLPELIHPLTKRIHSSFNQAVAQTGRLSSDKPNLQNIPIRGTEGRRIREAFCPQNDDCIFVSADYSQIELRVLAHVSGDENMITAFKGSADIHTSTASKIFGKPANEVTREDRSRAKAINFGIIYGMGPTRLAKENGVSLAEAKKFIENYKNTFPSIDQFFETKIAEARQTEYVSTFFGRKRLLSSINTSGIDAVTTVNMAKNTPIQGTAAEVIKLAMIKIQNKIIDEKLPFQLIGQVHDELLFEVKKDYLETAEKIIKDCMSNVVNWKIDLVVDVGKGPNWLDAH